LWSTWLARNELLLTVGKLIGMVFFNWYSMEQHRGWSALPSRISVLLVQISLDAEVASGVDKYRFSPTPVFFVIVRLLWLYINGLKPCRMKGIKISTKKKSCRDHKTKSLTIIIIFFADKHLITYTGSIQFFRHFLFVKMSHSTLAKLWTKLRTHNNPNSISQYNW
jgi:hypothetical protein